MRGAAPYPAVYRIREKYLDDPGPARDGHISYSFDSDRNQIGCGRIQKDSVRFGETVLLPIYNPLGELEMRIRGFNHSKMRVTKRAAEFERYDSSSNKVYFLQQTAVDKLTVSRNDQK